MGDPFKACVRCRQPSAVTRGNAAYCIPCNQVMEWSDVIAVVQASEEPPPATIPEPAGDSERHLPASPVAVGVEADPFSRRPS